MRLSYQWQVHGAFLLLFLRSILPLVLALMDPAKLKCRLPDIKFRVLIIGRANAGKTTILQRVCNTTDSPKIYRNGKELVCIL